MEVPRNNSIPQEELMRLAIRVREDLSCYEEKLGSCRDFDEVLKSADALITAIIGPEKFSPSPVPPNKGSQVHSFPSGRKSIPTSLH